MSKFVKGPVDWESIEAVYGGTDTVIWRKRIIATIKLMGSDIGSVLDVGAGSMFLKKILPPGVQYYPLDYERHCDETLVCDLNAYEFPDVTADAAVLAGILEYLNDVDWLFDTLASRVSMIVLSYKGKEGGFEQSVYTSDELITKLRTRGFILTGRDEEFKEWPLLARFQKVTPQLLGANYFCTGCGACTSSCPTNAIELGLDSQGFLKPKINSEKCVNCNRCVEGCPSVHPLQNDHCAQPICYAGWAQDEIRQDSSSGGAFSVFAQNILREGGIVFGAAWTENFFLAHKGIFNVEELAELRHSKFAQSYTGDTFRKVRDQLEKGKPVLYVGTPCQISGLYSFLGNGYDRLYTIDLLCFCAPPITAFRKYLSEQHGIKNVRQVVFRDKCRGWLADGYSIYKRDGNVLQPVGGSDDYQKAYHTVLLRNSNCENCIYAGFPRQGDITLGDFWGIEQHDSTWNDGKGTSVILINSEKGQQLLNAVQGEFLRIEQVPLDWVRGKGNRIEKDGRPRHKGAEEFLSDLEKCTFHEAVERTILGKRDIGLVCMHNDNYGNNLTNYALYQYLNDSGYSVAMIDQAKDAPWVPQTEKLSLFGHIPYKTMDLFPSSDDKLQLKKMSEKFDLFLVGSDQLFRAVFSEGLDLHPCMDWVTANKPKVSYATSFGVEFFEGDSTLRAKMGYYLNRFQALSVREASGVDILKREFGIDGGVCVLDPVFLCDQKNFEDMAQFGKLRLPQKPYLGGYILDPSEKKAALIDKILKENRLEELSVISDGCVEEAGQDTSGLWNKPILKHSLIEEWLANVLYSDVFVTDSFHGVCFALIFEKDFWIVTNENCWRGGERLRNLLSMLGLENRLILEEADLNAIDLTEHIDYSQVNQRLNWKREESKTWLRQSLELRKSFCGNYDAYDILGEQIDGNLVKLQRLEERVMDDENRFENGLRSSAVQFEGMLKAELQVSREAENALWQQLRVLVEEEMKKNQEAERIARQQLQALLEEERKKSQEAEYKLEQALREKSGLEHQIATMYLSNSWQITWPLRKIRAVFRRFIGKMK